MSVRPSTDQRAHEMTPGANRDADFSTAFIRAFDDSACFDHPETQSGGGPGAGCHDDLGRFGGAGQQVESRPTKLPSHPIDQGLEYLPVTALLLHEPK